MARMRLGIVLGVVLVAIALSCLPDIEISAPPQARACGDGFVQISLGEQCDPGDGSAGCGSDCRLLCDGGQVDPRTNHCYFAAGASTTLSSARGACSSGHLVTFVSADELAFVSTRVLGGGWLDLDRRFSLDAGIHFGTGTREPGWARTCSGCYANAGPLNVSFPPLEGGTDGPCVIFTRQNQTTWFATPCDLSASNIALPVICEREPPGKATFPCDAGDCIELQPTIGDKSYVLVRAPAPFEEAKITCNQMVARFPGARTSRLVVLETREEREELARAVAETDAGSFFIGLADHTWSDGQPVDGGLYPSPWAQNEPASSAPAHVSEDDRFDTRHARTDARPHPFVCEIRWR